MSAVDRAKYAHYASQRVRDSELAQINRMRDVLGLKELKTKDRKCMRCGKPFPSESTANRVCSSCKMKDAKNEGYYEYYGV